MPERGADASMCVILGGGGHAEVLLDALEAGGGAMPGAILDADRVRWGHEMRGVPILGDEGVLPGLATRGFRCFAVGIGGVRASTKRRELYELALELALEPLTIIHPRAVCSPAADIGPGAQVLPVAVINAKAEIGANCIVNTGAIVEHGCTLAGHVHVASGAVLAGDVEVGACSHIGAGATVLQGARIGQGVTIGAGAVVIGDIPDQTVAVGVPARPLD